MTHSSNFSTNSSTVFAWHNSDTNPNGSDIEIWTQREYVMKLYLKVHRAEKKKINAQSSTIDSFVNLTFMTFHFFLKYAIEKKKRF